MSQVPTPPIRPNLHGADGESRERRIDLWRLPRLESLAARRVRLAEPRVYYVGTERRETREVVELRATTSEPLPVRAVTPVLVVGETEIADYEPDGPNRVRFIAFEPDRLAEGSAIRWGWPGRPERLIATPFRLSLDSAQGPVAGRGSAGRGGPRA